MNEWEQLNEWIGSDDEWDYEPITPENDREMTEEEEQLFKQLIGNLLSKNNNQKEDSNEH